MMPENTEVASIHTQSLDGKTESYQQILKNETDIEISICAEKKNTKIDQIFPKQYTTPLESTNIPSSHDRLLQENVQIHNQISEKELLKNNAFIHVRKVLYATSIYDLIMLLESCSPKVRRIIWLLIDLDQQANILKQLENGSLNDILRTIQPNTIGTPGKMFKIDNISSILRNIPDHVYHDLLSQMEAQDKNRSNAGHEFSLDLVGNMMYKNLITLRYDVSVDVSLRYIRMRGPKSCSITVFFVVDTDNILVGYIPVITLLTAKLDQIIQEIMSPVAVKVSANMQIAEINTLFTQHELYFFPVVDDNCLLLGQIISNNGNNRIHMSDKKEESIFTPILQSTIRRAVWLSTNLLTALLAASVSDAFETIIDQLAALAVLMTIVPSMGGIAGTQTLSLVIRAQATDNIENLQSWLLCKEISIGLLNGLLWGLFLGIVVFVWKNNFAISLIIAGSMFVTMVIAGLFGALIPLLMVKVGIDPALAGSMALTAMTDVGGLISFLGIATFVSHWNPELLTGLA